MMAAKSDWHLPISLILISYDPCFYSIYRLHGCIVLDYIGILRGELLRCTLEEKLQWIPATITCELQMSFSIDFILFHALSLTWTIRTQVASQQPRDTNACATAPQSQANTTTAADWYFHPVPIGMHGLGKLMGFRRGLLGPRWVEWCYKAGRYVLWAA
jgi:hypothetical protein